MHLRRVPARDGNWIACTQQQHGRVGSRKRGLVVVIDGSDEALESCWRESVRRRRGDGRDGDGESRSDVATMPPIEWPMSTMGVSGGCSESMEDMLLDM